MAAIALLLPSAAAAWAADVQTPGVVVDDGAVEGKLAAARFETPDADLDAVEWWLSGSSLDVFTWNAQTNVTIGSPVGLEEPYESEAHHGAFSAVIDSGRAGARLSMVENGGSGRLLHQGIDVRIGPAERATFSDEGLSTSPGSENPRTQPVDVRDTAHLESGPNWGNITIRGDFAIHAWEIDWLVTDEEGEHLYKSGWEEEPYVSGQPPLPVGHVGTTHVRDVYMYVTDGVLTLTSVSDGQLEYFLREWSAEAPQGIELSNVFGTVVHGALATDLDNSTVYLPGPVSFTNGTSGSGSLMFDAFTPSDIIFVDGVKIEPSPAAPEDAATSTTTVVQQGPDWWFAPALALFLLGLAWVGVRFQKPFWYVRWAMRRGRHAFVVKEAPRFFGPHRTRKRAVMMHSLALLGIGRFEEAVEFWFSIMDEDRPDGPTWDYMAAMALAGAGSFDEATHYLDRCLRSAPQYMEEVRDNPLLMRLLSEHAPAGDGVSYA